MTKLDELMKAAVAAGWTVNKTKSSHWKLLGPGGALVVLSGTPSDHRSGLNARARLRRAGLGV